LSIPKYEFSSNIQLVNIGDVHRGDDVCDVNSFRKVIQYVKQHDNVRWYSTGDLLNNALKNSKSDVYQSMAPQKEFDIIIRELKPISSKCLGMVVSNHMRRTQESAGISLDKMLSAELEIPFLGKLGLICVKVGAACYYVAMHHGVGNGKRRGTKVNSLEDLAAIIPGADIYTEGHFHTYATFKNDMPYIDRKRNTRKMFTATFAATGHFLNWEKSYAQDYKMRPMPKGASLMELLATPDGSHGRKKVIVDLLD